MKNLRSGVCSLLMLLGVALHPTISKAQATDQLRIAVRAFLSTVDPHFHHLGINRGFNRHIFDSLINVEPDFSLSPGLALSWTQLDPVTWEFKLRPEVKFHDGSSFTAEDVIFSVMRIREVPASPSRYTDYIRMIAKMEAVDPLTLRITTDNPYPLLPNALAYVSIATKRGSGGATTADFNSGKLAFGTGPYVFREYQAGSIFGLERNEDYWGDKPEFKRVTFRAIPNDATRLASLLSGEVDVIDKIPTADASGLARNPAFSIITAPANRQVAIWMIQDPKYAGQFKDKAGKPLDRNPFADKRVRVALAKAVDRDLIISHGLDSYGRPIYQMAGPGDFGQADFKPEPVDVAGARTLLAEAGYPEGFSVALYGSSDNLVNELRIYQILAQLFARVGVTVTPSPMPNAAFQSKVRPQKWEFPFFVAGWANNFNNTIDALENMIHSFDEAKNFGRSNRFPTSAEVDRLVESTLRESDRSKRETTQKRVAEIYMQDTPMIPLHVQVSLWGMRKDLTMAPNGEEHTLAFRIRRGL